MSRMNTRTRMLAVALALGTAVSALTACGNGDESAVDSAPTTSTAPAENTPVATEPTPTPASAGQSKAEACDLVEQGLADAAEAVQSAAGGTPEEGLQVFDTLKAEVEAVSADITNEEVLAALQPLAESFGSFAELMKEASMMGAEGQAELMQRMQAEGEKLQASTSAVDAVCS